MIPSKNKPALRNDTRFSSCNGSKWVLYARKGTQGEARALLAHL